MPYLVECVMKMHYTLNRPVVLLKYGKKVKVIKLKFIETLTSKFGKRHLPCFGKMNVRLANFGHQAGT